MDLAVSLHEVQAAATRARTLTIDLERTNRPEDRHQVAAGVRYELDTILRLVHDELERLERAATSDQAGKVRRDAPATSRAAAQAITLQTGTARWRILERLVIAHDSGWGGLTDWELQQQLRLNPSTERPRRGELVDAGLVESHGERQHGDSHWAIWKLTQAGADAYQERTQGPPRVVTQTGDPTLF